jgi:hypothetical protein
MYKHLIPLALAVVLALPGCGGTQETDPASTVPELPDLAGLTVAWECGHGFWLGNADQTVAIRFQANDAAGLTNGAVPALTTLPDTGENWSVTLTLGKDLYANWCDDAIEEGEPEPVIEETWDIAAGTIEVVSVPRANECGPATAWARDLVAAADDGRTVEIGDLLLTNPAWGCFAG